MPEQIHRIILLFRLNGDLVTCSLTSNAICATGNPAASTPITMTVNPVLPVNVSIAVSNNPVCSAVPVTFIATPTNGGSLPVFQWKLNGSNVGSNSQSYIFSPANGDVVNCILTSDVSCPQGNPATSNSIAMTISPNPVVTFTSCFDTITSINAKPFKLKGGIPLNGTYSGPGVNSVTSVFTPVNCGTGIKAITYSYTNAALCNASKIREYHCPIHTSICVWK